jgi:hypothetical protein
MSLPHFPLWMQRMHFRDLSWKEEILIERISNYQTNFGHIGATLGRAQAKNGGIIILKCILEIGHGRRNTY